eukprot:g46153.t1
MASQIVSKAIEWPFIVQSELIEKEEQKNKEGDELVPEPGKPPSKKQKTKEEKELQDGIDEALRKQEELKTKLATARRVGNKGKTVHFDASVLTELQETNEELERKIKEAANDKVSHEMGQGNTCVTCYSFVGSFPLVGSFSSSTQQPQVLYTEQSGLQGKAVDLGNCQNRG